MFKRWREQWLGARRRFDELTEQTRLNGHRLDHLSWQLDLLTRENRMLMSYFSLPPHEIWRGKPHVVDGAPAAAAFPHSTLCRQESFEQPYFSFWTRRLGVYLNYHRKVWEHVFICQALWERGAIRPDARGLGFGVGREPLTAYFASAGCNVLATDLASEQATEAGWRATDQHADSLEGLWRPGLCERSQFDQRVRFQVCDMNQVPDDFLGFDFCWSVCSLEHLGSIEHGLRFIERSLQCLKPGGWAVHTTEFNLTSNTHTVETGGTVLFRQLDMEALAERLTAQGHAVAPFDFNQGLAPLDRYIDVAPYRPEPHLKLALDGYAATSIGLIVQRRA